jgi:hypothetical protein
MIFENQEGLNMMLGNSMNVHWTKHYEFKIARNLEALGMQGL